MWHFCLGLLIFNLRNNTTFARYQRENHCIKADASRCCHASQIPLFYRPSSVASSLSMPLYPPLSNVALLPFLLLLPCRSFSLHRWLAIFLSLSTSNSEPIAARGCSPFFPPSFLCPAIFPFFSHFLLSLLLFSPFFSFPVRQFRLL